MSRTLTPEELAPYMPYGLSFILTENIRHYFVDEFWQDDALVEQGAIWQLIGLNKIENSTPYIQVGEGELCEYLFANGNTFASFTEGCKPLLRPLSDLTKEIEHDGKRFVPIEEVIKLMGFSPNYTKMLDWQYRKVTENTEFIVIGSEVAKKELIVWMGKDTLRTEYWVIQKLISWHFNVFNLPQDLFIDINTVQQ